MSWLRRWFARPRVRWLVSIGAIGIAAALWIRLGPIPAGLLDDRAAQSTVVLDRRGVPLYEALSGDGARSVSMSADALPPVLASATVAAEDRRFWSHPGIDVIAVVRAVKRNIVARDTVEGGSTISQQVAKLLLSRRAPGRRRGVGAKVYEAVLAQRLEHRFAKREILAYYLNLASYGNQLVGAERASRAYFGCAASMLTPAQAAFLAGLPQRPSGFNPYRSRDAAVRRQQTVLARMASTGALTPEQSREARAERLVFAPQGSPFSAPHFVEKVLAEAGEPRPARIQTTLDAGLQADVTGIIRSHRELLEKHGAANVAVVVLDNATGEWRAWEGSGNYTDTEHGGAIDGARTARQPGSTLKPFTYALAFEQGFSPASVLPDIPSHFPTAETGVLYSPRNYDGRYRGPLLARRALAESENVPAVALASEVGAPKLLRFLLRAGFSTLDRNAADHGLGMTLGNAEVRLDQLAAAYSALARGGTWIEPRSLPGAASESRQLVSARTAFWLTDILSDPEAREYIFGRGGSLEFPFPVAVKTGTSQAYHDNWTVGYSRHVTVAVWVGNFDRTPLRDSTGVTGAGPIFHAVMQAAEERANAGDAGATILNPPADTASREICSLSGMAANAWCPRRQMEWVDGALEPVPCSWHHLSDEGLLVAWPAEYRHWARSNRLLAPASGAIPQPKTAMRREAGTSPRAGLTIVNPPAGATYLIDPTLRREFQTLAFRAASSGSTRIVWSVNGREAGSSNADGSYAWPLSPGQHRIVARDDRGREALTEIVVR